MVCPSSRGRSAFGGQQPGIGPSQEVGICRARGCVIVLAGDVEAEIDKGLAVGFDEGGVAGRPWLALGVDNDCTGAVR